MLVCIWMMFTEKWLYFEKVIVWEVENHFISPSEDVVCCVRHYYRECLHIYCNILGLGKIFLYNRSIV